MRRLLIVAGLAALTSGMMLADSVSISGSDTFINMPSNTTFAANTTLGNTPYWNNRSLDGAQFNVGYFLTDTGAFSANTLVPAPAQYLGNTANNNLAPTAFSFLSAASSIQVTILYQNAGANSGAFGTSFGVYDTSNGAQTPIYTAGTVPANVGVITNVSTTASYGFYATTCQNSTNGTNCFTFFSNPSIDAPVTNFGSGTVVEAPGSHQHFALFTVAGDSNSFYLGYEDSLNGGLGFGGTSGFENYGDFNDIIVRITTVPEPGTFAFLGLGLVALGLRARKLRK
jgi:hypothetical protein